MTTEQQIQDDGQDDTVESVLASELKADLEKVIYQYGREKLIPCYTVIKVLADLSIDMADIIENSGENEEEETEV